MKTHKQTKLSHQISNEKINDKIDLMLKKRGKMHLFNVKYTFIPYLIEQKIGKKENFYKKRGGKVSFSLLDLGEKSAEKRKWDIKVPVEPT